MFDARLLFPLESVTGLFFGSDCLRLAVACPHVTAGLEQGFGCHVGFCRYAMLAIRAEVWLVWFDGRRLVDFWVTAWPEGCAKGAQLAEQTRVLSRSINWVL